MDFVQRPVDADLTAIAALAGTSGLLAKTAADTWALRTLTAPAAGVTVSNGSGAGGNPTLALANDLAALEALASTGLAVRTGSDTWAQRTITGTANEIALANGDGVGGNPTISLPTALTFTSKTITGGTFASPTLSGTVAGAVTFSGSTLAFSGGTATSSSGTGTVVVTGGIGLSGTLWAGAGIRATTTFTSDSTGSVMEAQAATTNAKYVRITNNGVDLYFGTESNSAGGFFTGSSAYDACFWTPGRAFLRGGTGVAINAGSGVIALTGELKLSNGYSAGAPAATGYVTVQDSAGNTMKLLCSNV